MRRSDRDMTQGTIWKQLVLFALPLLAGNVFQQFYNTVDSIVVGNYVGKEALAAVGSVGPIISSLIGFFMGLATGAGVVISQAYGAKNGERVSKTVHTTLVMTGVLCVIMSIAGVLMTPYMLRMMSTPDDVFQEAATYLRIYFAGVSGLMIYNMGAGILRAVGDSRRPLYFLIFSALTNTVLDIVFVVTFRMGIAGAALATVIAQVLSAALIIIVLARSDGDYRLILGKLRMDKGILKDIVELGLPAALQMLITSFSNVFVQSYINHFGSSVMAGWSAYTKLDQFIILPMQSLGLSATTFIGQNYGAQKIERIKKGMHTAMGLSVITTALLVIPLLIFRETMVGLFNQNQEVIRYGSFLLMLMTPFYPICCMNQIVACTLRGLGDTKTPMIIMLCSFVLFRQIYLFIVSRTIGTLTAVALGYPAGWLVCTVLMQNYQRWYWKKRWGNSNL